MTLLCYREGLLEDRFCVQESKDSKASYNVLYEIQQPELVSVVVWSLVPSHSFYANFTAPLGRFPSTFPLSKVDPCTTFHTLIERYLPLFWFYVYNTRLAGLMLVFWIIFRRSFSVIAVSQNFSRYYEVPSYVIICNKPTTIIFFAKH